MPDFGIMRGFGSKLFSDKLVAGQLPTQLGLIGSDDFGTDPDAQAFFDRVTAAGGTLSATEQLAVDQLVFDMKAYGIWSAMKAVYPMVGASAAACAQNLVSASFTGTFTSGWTFASTGVTPNGTSAYMNTNFIPNTHLTYPNGSLGFATNQVTITPAAVDLGVQDSGGWFNAWSNSFGFSTARLGFPSEAAGPAYTSPGNIFGSRTTSSLSKLYRNGNAVASDTNPRLATAFATANPVYLGALNDNGTSNYYTSNRYTFVFMANSITDGNATNLNTVINTFNSTLSR